MPENRGFPVTDINMRHEEAVEKFELHELLDEPTSGLDLGSMMLTAQILQKSADNGKICIVVTHDNELINKLYEREDNNA